MNIKTIRLGNTLDWEHSINISAKNFNTLDKSICFSEYIRSIFMSKNVVDLGIFYSHCRINDRGTFVDIEIYLYDWWFNDVILLRRRSGVKQLKRSLKGGVKATNKVIEREDSFIFDKKIGNITWKDICILNKRNTNIIYRKALASYVINKGIGSEVYGNNKLFDALHKDLYVKGYLLDKNRRIQKDRYLFDYKTEWYFLKKKLNKKEYLYEKKYAMSSDIKTMQIYRFACIEKLLLVAGYKYFNKKVIFNYCMLTEKLITADLVSRYICFRLKQGYLLGEILNGVIKTIEKWKLRNSGIIGYRFECSGRFGRKQRTSFKSVSEGKLCRSKVSSCVDFGMNNVILKFGCCNIKVWLHKSYNVQEYAYKLKV